MLPILAAGFFWLIPSVLAQAQSTGKVTMPPVTVTAQKEPADAQKLPVSVTPVTRQTIDDDDVTLVSDAARFAPNTYFTEFTARKLSNARFRGVGSGPTNPGVTTYIDGVPQLNANSSSIELVDISQIEFVRGPQSALFGRNTLGGIVNIASARPTRTWTGNASLPFGNDGAREVRASVSGPLTQKMAATFSGGRTDRDGFTTNDLTGHDLDSRSASFGKGQVAWMPRVNFEMRAIVSGERARDGDYALGDLASIRLTPFHVMRDFEGHTDRDITTATVLTRMDGSRVSWSTTTGIVRWKTFDSTDLDYSPLPLATRDNDEKDLQWTEELRLASAPKASIKVGSGTLRWQTGVFMFTQNYKQNAVNHFAPFVISQFINFPVDQSSPLATLDDFGVGVYGQATMTWRDKLDLTAGARVDHERKQADLNTFFDPPLGPPAPLNLEDSFNDVSPQVAVGYRGNANTLVYASISRGFKAGGFNPASPQGSETYGEEHTWNVEGGLKSTWGNGRVTTNIDVFSIMWDDLQLNVPNLQVPGQFFIANVGKASSRGVEVELGAHPISGVNVFATVGTTRARVESGSALAGQSIAGNTIPNAPAYTASFGGELSHLLTHDWAAYGRAEAVFYGSFQYDDMNTASQAAYSLADFRGGVRSKRVFGEAWVRNAFDTRYIPVAFQYVFAQSGFIGEQGKPRTFGVRFGVTF